jgi:hypothetical protein
MSIVTEYEPGTPCWVELATPDLDAAAMFAIITMAEGHETSPS